MTVDPSATSGTDGHAGPVVLPLVDGPFRPRHTVASTAHIILSLTALLLRIPFHLVWHYVLYRWRSPYVQDLGRWWFHEPAVMLFRMLFSRTYIRPSRPFFRVALPSKYVAPMEEVAGTRGKWVVPPGVKGERKDDDLVMLWVHGGGFIIDTGVACQDFHIALAKDMEKRGVRFSVFMVDYHLAPEKIYPSQPIECLAAYHFLVNDLDIPPSKICFAGDSAGGNLVMSVLLHLARPNPAFNLPKSLGSTPGRPGSVMLFSPFIDFLSRRPSRVPPYARDYTDSGGVFHGVLHYLGLTAPYPPELEGWRHPPYWDLLSFFSGENSAAHPPEEVRVEKLRERVEAEGGKRGLGLLANPYVNPSTEVVTDRSWCREALPGEGQTFVSWGGKEIFADDVEDFANVLEEAGVAPYKLVKPLGTHDWPLFDTMLPITARDRLGGEQSQPGYAVRKISEWLVERVKEKRE